MSSSATREPSARKRFAVASPMPRAAPVTRADFESWGGEWTARGGVEGGGGGRRGVELQPSGLGEREVAGDSRRITRRLRGRERQRLDA